jgi:hypothetical protein
MTEFTPIAGAVGGLLIALSAIVLMGGFGRVAGLSGIFGGLFTGNLGREFTWRAIFVAGVLVGAALMALLGAFETASIAFSGGPAITIAGGLLVGAGTAMGSGCTSGHGICGISRMSLRSIVATGTFMAAAIATVFLTRHVIGG